MSPKLTTSWYQFVLYVLHCNFHDLKYCVYNLFTLFPILYILTKVATFATLHEWMTAGPESD